MKRLRISTYIFAVLAGTAQASGEPFPVRQVTIVSPYQAGGTSDIIARTIAQHLATIWPHPVIVENRPGANGAIALQMVARAQPDGHTILATASSALTLNPSIYAKLSYDVKVDFATISRTGQVANVLVVNPSVSAKSLSELIALAKASPGKLTFASQGIGSNGHVNGELFKMRAGIDLLHVPYKGSAPAVTDLVGGQVQLMFDNLPSVLEQIQGGTLRALAVTSASRSPQLPNIPTMTEAGLANFDTTAWFALLVGKKTPEHIRAAIEQVVVRSLSEPQVRQRLSAAGVEVVGSGAADLDKKIDEDTVMWKEVIQAGKISVQ